MTWGQLRLQLQTSASGLSLDLLDEYLNARYEQVLEATDWSGLDGTATIQTIAAWQSTTDSVSLTVGSANVTATKAWTDAINGRKFYRPGDSVIYSVTWVSANAFTLDRPYEGNGTDAAGTVFATAAYVLMQNIYELPSDCGSIVTLMDPITGLPLDEFTRAELDNSAGPRTNLADPRCYALADDTTETSPPVLHQVELFPPPLYARGIPLQYRRGAFGFDGQNTSAGPLPWVSATVLLEGCRADIQLYLASASEGGAVAAHLNAAKAYELKFERELNRLLGVEYKQRRKKPVLRMAARFTRHRLARANRGALSNWRGGTPGGPN